MLELSLDSLVVLLEILSQDLSFVSMGSMALPGSSVVDSFIMTYRELEPPLDAKPLPKGVH